MEESQLEEALSSVECSLTTTPGQRSPASAFPEVPHERSQGRELQPSPFYYGDACLRNVEHMSRNTRTDMGGCLLDMHHGDGIR
eukprot:4335080-Amphidinium_carterae.1